MEENKKTPKDNKDIKKLADDIKDVLDGSGVNQENLEGTSKEMFDGLDINEIFNKEIEEILALLNEQTTDLTLLQSKIILLIKKYLNKDKKLDIDLAIDDKLMAHDIAEVSHYLMEHKAAIMKDANSKLPRPKDKYYGMTANSRADFRKIIKNFAVYQVYKFLNPKRIAGETRVENFANNMIMGGMYRAKHYAGGSEQEVAKYSPEFIKKLEDAHKTFKKGGMII